MADKVLADVFSKFLFGLGAGVVADAIVEITKFPLLNEPGLFGNSAMSNFETLSYAIGVGGITAGAVDVFTGKQVLGFSKDLIPFLAGYIVGIQNYETWIADKTGIRAFDPYATVKGYIPQF